MSIWLSCAEYHGYRSFTGRDARILKSWLDEHAEMSRSNEGLDRAFVDQCRRSRTILPGTPPWNSSAPGRSSVRNEGSNPGSRAA